jgi:hypothetical protein
MKNTLTEQKKINELISKFFSRLIQKRSGKTVDDMIKKNPELAKAVDGVNKSIDSFNKAFRKKHGNKFADKFDKDLDNLLK